MGVRQLLAAAINVARDAAYTLNTVTGLYERTLLVEGASANLCLQSENFGTTWTLNGTPTRTGAAIASSVMGVTLDLIGDDDAAVSEAYLQTVTFTGDGTKALSIFVKKGSSPGPGGTDFVLRDTTAVVDRLQGTITWDAGGVPTIVAATGTHHGTPVSYTSGIYRPRFSAPGIVAANTNQIQMWPCRRSTSADTGNVYAGGVQAENNAVPSSYKATTTATVARSADLLSFPFTPPPQEITFNTKFIDQGAIFENASKRVYQIGNAAGTGARLLVYATGAAGAGRYRCDYNNGTTTVSAIPTAGGTVVYGDTVELRLVLGADGAVFIGQSVNGGAEVISPVSAANALPSAWAAATLWLGSLNGGSAPVIAFLDRAFIALRGVQSLATCRAA